MSANEQLIDAKGQMDALAVQKKDIESRLTVLKNKIRCEGNMPGEKYRQVCETQNSYSRSIVQIEKKMAPLRKRIQELAHQEHAEYRALNGNGQHKPEDQAPIVAALVALRQYYQDFAADGTRVSSMRTMAADFVLKLNPIIKRAVNHA